MNSNLFITGLSRSGTTLLEKLLNNHPDIAIASQPFPYLYRHLKKKFFDSIQYPQTYYVLNNLFKEDRYTARDLNNFLDHYSVSQNELREIFIQMKNFTGQWTIMNDAGVSNYDDQNLQGAFSHLLKHATASDKKVRGAKEINCEEFVSYFINNGIKCIVILRDPRDVITSLNIGRGEQFGGQHRPTLFHIRNWRKSVA